MTKRDEGKGRISIRALGFAASRPDLQKKHADYFCTALVAVTSLTLDSGAASGFEIVIGKNWREDFRFGEKKLCYYAARSSLKFSVACQTRATQTAHSEVD
jgi:hypothetical protein